MFIHCVSFHFSTIRISLCFLLWRRSDKIANPDLGFIVSVKELHYCVIGGEPSWNSLSSEKEIVSWKIVIKEWKDPNLPRCLRQLTQLAAEVYHFHCSAGLSASAPRSQQILAPSASVYMWFKLLNDQFGNKRDANKTTSNWITVIQYSFSPPPPSVLCMNKCHWYSNISNTGLGQWLQLTWYSNRGLFSKRHLPMSG